jgi:hypothetical protein
MQATSSEAEEAVLKLVMELKEKGNAEFKEENLLEAKVTYRKALTKLNNFSKENSKEMNDYS